jgi:predicted DCC family thiol-disulfide oxidoreductase YuxK
MPETTPAAAPFADLLPPGASAIVIFDGLCHFCDRSVQFMLRHDPAGTIRYAPSQSPVAAAILARSGLPAAPGTIVLVEADRVSLRSTAALRIARRLGLPWSIAGVLLWLPAWMRDPVYAVIARYRIRWFGRRDACRIPTPEQASRFL